VTGVPANPFAEAVAARLGNVLASHGFVLAGGIYDPEVFGNAIVEYRSAKLRLRFILDRGQVFCEAVRPLSLGWSNFCSAEPYDLETTARRLEDRLASGGA
jgi:hypothetical protein